LKFWNSIMSGLVLAPLAMAGCPSDDTMADTETASASSSTTSDDTTSGSSTAVVDSSTGELTTGDMTTGDIFDCHADRPPPPGPDCSGATTVIDGSVIIEDGGDTPAALEGVIEVTGAVRINRTAETNLDFMACLQTVGADVTIFGNEQLTNVDGLWSLTSIGTDFVFSQNNALVDFNGLPNVAQLVDNLVMRENASLQTITGFNSLVGINGSVNEMGEMQGGNITIQENPVLEDINGLGEVLVVNGVFAVNNNPMLCMSSVNCVGTGIVQPAIPPDTWTTVGNNDGC
jgi:hypothetical protein